MGPVKVCYVAREVLFPPIEGHHIASRRVIEAAARAGIHANVITIESETKNLGNPKKWVIVNSKAGPRAHYWFMPLMHSAIDDLSASVRISSQIKFTGDDLIHVLNVNKEVYLFAHSLLRVKKPLLMHFYHSPQVLADDVFLIRNLAFRAGLYGRSLGNHVLTVNLSLYKYFIEKLGVDYERVHYAPYPIDTDTFRPLNNKEVLRKKYGLPSGRPIVVYVGSLDPVRGIYDLIKSIRLVSDYFPRVLLYVAHPHRKGEEIYEKRSNEFIRKLRLQKNVAIRGPSAHVEEIYNVADIVVFPFKRAYWVDPPLVLLEAMSSGAAVVVTSVGAINEVVNDHGNAVFTKPGDPRILAKAIIELIRNPSERHKIGQKARETIVQNYSYKVVGNKLLKIYDFILDHLN